MARVKGAMMARKRRNKTKNLKINLFFQMIQLYYYHFEYL